MPHLPRTLRSWRHLAEALALICVVGVAGVAAFAWSGLYNISAARDHLPLVTWFLEQVRDQSVRTQSAGIDVPPLDDPDMVLLGAAHYESVCAACHSRPGETVSAIVAQMLPSPPLLAPALEENTPEQIFWVVKHGLKYTGMPAWPTQSRDDEVWAVTAFLSRLAAGNPMEDYDPLAGLDRTAPPFVAGAQSGGVRPVSLVRCSRCHDDMGLPTHGGLVPRLGRQSEAYLRRALAEYASGARPSGIMQPVAQALDPARIEELVGFYAGLPPAGAGVEADPDRVARGRQLAMAGAGDRGLPPCLACHGAGASAAFPQLAGQNAAYIERQLQVFRAGGRNVSTYGQIMTAVARRLSAEESSDVAAYFSTRPEPEAVDHARPVPP